MTGGAEQGQDLRCQVGDDLGGVQVCLTSAFLATHPGTPTEISKGIKPTGYD